MRGCADWECDFDVSFDMTCNVNGGSPTSFLVNLLHPVLSPLNLISAKLNYRKFWIPLPLVSKPVTKPMTKPVTLISLINVEPTLTNFKKFHPPQKKNSPPPPLVVQVKIQILNWLYWVHGKCTCTSEHMHAAQPSRCTLVWLSSLKFKSWTDFTGCMVNAQ